MSLPCAGTQSTTTCLLWGMAALTSCIRVAAWYAATASRTPPTQSTSLEQTQVISMLCICDVLADRCRSCYSPKESQHIFVRLSVCFVQKPCLIRRESDKGKKLSPASHGVPHPHAPSVCWETQGIACCSCSLLAAMQTGSPINMTMHSAS